MNDETGTRQEMDDFEKAFYGPVSDRISPVRLFSTMLRYRRLLVRLPLLVCLLLIAYALIKTSTYTSYASFMSQTTSPTEMRFTGLAAQLGLSAPVMTSGQSPEFFSALMETDQILRAVVDSRYRYWTEDRLIEGDLVDIYGVRGEDAEVRRDKAVEKLSEAMSVGVARNTEIVTFSVKAHNASLAVQISERFLELLNAFNLESLQTQAAAEREFVEGRVEKARGELREAENQLETFLRQNVQYDNDPQLRFLYNRLQREVDMRQQVYTSLVQSFEQARIDEVRDTPVITIVEEPYPPVRPDSRRLILMAVLGVFLGLVFGIFVAFTNDLIISTGSDDTEDYRNMLELRQESLSDLRHPWRFLIGK